MAPRVGEKYNTSIPKRENELKSSGPGEVIRYQLSEEELAKYRAMPVPDKKGKLPVGVMIAKSDSGEQRRRANMRYSKEENDVRVAKEGPTCGLTKEILIEEVAKGETLSSIERAWGMKYNTIHNWVKKWDLKGINSAKAQELLDELKQPVMKEKNVQQNDAVKAEVYQQTSEMLKKEKKELEKEIEFLRKAKADMQSVSEKLLQERDDYKRAAEDLEEKVLEYDHLSETHRQTKERLSELEKEHAEMVISTEQLNAAAETVKRDPNSTYETLVELGVLQKPSDPVNPLHYGRGGIECIDAIEAATSGLSGPEAYSTGEAIKYLWRWKWKNGREDLQKAAWYINRLIGGE